MNSEYSDFLDSFTHWTYHITNEYLLVCDLKGFLIENNTVYGEYLLSKLMVTSQSDLSRFIRTNIGIVAILNYFRKHKCNKICTGLKLKKHAYQR